VKENIYNAKNRILSMKCKDCWVLTFILLFLGIGAVDAFECTDLGGDEQLSEIECETGYTKFILSDIAEDFYWGLLLKELNTEKNYRILIKKEGGYPVQYYESIEWRIEFPGYTICFFDDITQTFECPSFDEESISFPYLNNILFAFYGIFNTNFIDKVPSEEKWNIEVREYLDVDEGTYFSKHFQATLKFIKPLTLFHPSIDGSQVIERIDLNGVIFSPLGDGTTNWVNVKIVNKDDQSEIDTFEISSRNSDIDDSIDWGVENTPVILWSVEWNPEGIPDGDYTIFAEACTENKEDIIVCGDRDSVQVTLASPIEIIEIDESPPVLTNKTPKDGSTINNRRPLIAITANDPESGIDVGKIEITINGDNVKVNFDYDSNIVSYRPTDNLPYGVYNVEVTVPNAEDDPISATERWSFTISEGPVPDVPPSVDLSVASNRGEGPFNVNFSYACEQGSAPLSSCKIEFGDGNFIELMGPDKALVTGDINHTYASKEGYYSAVLNAHDNSGNRAEDFLRIYSLLPANKAPVVEDIIVTPQFSELDVNVTVNEGEGIEFKVAAIDPNEEDILTYTWDFGDGESSDQNEVYHSYFFTEGEIEKTFTVKVTVSDGELETSKTQIVTVEKALMKVKIYLPNLETQSLSKGGKVKVQMEITDIDEVRLGLDNISKIFAYFETEDTPIFFEPGEDGFFWGEFESGYRTPNTGYIFVVAEGVVLGEWEKTGTVSQVKFSPMKLKVAVTTNPKIPPVGSTLENISLRLDYQDEIPVNDATVIGMIQGSDLGNILFTESASGIYEANLNYEVQPRDSGGLFLLFKATDDYGNGSEEFIEYRIETNPLNPFLNTIAGIIAIVFVIIIGSYLLLQRIRDKQKLRAGLLGEKTILERELKQLKYKYHKREITEAKYKEKILRVEQQLTTVEELLGVEKTTEVKVGGGEKEKMIGSMRKEIKEVDKMVKSLREKKGKFTKKEMKEAIISEGYTVKIADKVVDILYKDD